MAGCAKADRTRKHPTNVRYKAENRRETNKVRKMKRAGQDPSKRPVANYKPRKESAVVLKSAEIMVNHQRYSHIKPLYWVCKDGVVLDVTPHRSEAHLLAKARNGGVHTYGCI